MICLQNRIKQHCKVENFTYIMIFRKLKSELSTFSTGFSTYESKTALQIEFVKPFSLSVYIHVCFAP